MTSSETDVKCSYLYEHKQKKGGFVQFHGERLGGLLVNVYAEICCCHELGRQTGLPVV